MTLVVPARAKLNLDLEVLGRNEDGFHEIRTQMQAVALHDLIEMTPADDTSLTATGLPVTLDKHNSILRAHQAMEHAGGRTLATHFHLHKRIPAGSGLGGASSDAASTLRGLADLYALTFTGSDLAAIATALGADVPFFLKGGTALAEGRGERLTQVQSPAGPSWFAIAWPGIELLTVAVYRAWDEVKGDSPNQLTRAAVATEPRLHDFALLLGPGWQMTGSGSAFFLRCPSEDAAHRATAELNGWTTVTHTVGAWA